MEIDLTIFAANFRDMEEWNLDFEWLRVRHIVKKAFNRSALPDLNGVLFLIGMQELGYLKDKFTKEEKQDLMHVAVCKLLSQDGYYKFIGRDEEGWPVYEPIEQIKEAGVKNQERLLKEKVVQYFADLENENGGFNI
ncbi:MAG: hypothetical protein AAGK97_00435 [Bacteroidota bacterium]